jgi:hypothetical protein
MRKQFIIFVLVLLPLSLMAQTQGNYVITFDDEPSASSAPTTYTSQDPAPQEKAVNEKAESKKAESGKWKEESRKEESKKEASEQKEKNSTGIFTGFSGGMMVHAGYLFSDDPRKVFSNSGLGSEDYVKGLPKGGFCYGIGGALRIHLINHIHVGGEGFVSTMPLMGTGSKVRSGWGGAFCDVYTTWGKVRPLVGMTIGGGATSRLYVPKQAAVVVSTASDNMIYNAAYTKTPFFLLDPYIGLEIGLKGHDAVLIRIDYMLPFGKNSSKLTDNVKWSNFLSPSGPRLYIGFMFGKFNKNKID